MLEIAKINERFASVGAFSSPSRKTAIIEYLKGLNTPISYKIYQELLANKEL